MAAETQPDLRLATDARIRWSIPKQEWDAYVRDRERVISPCVGAVLSFVVVILLTSPVVLYFAASLSASRGRLSDGYGWLIVGAAAVFPVILAATLGRSAIRDLRTAIAFRRRGDAVWEREGCVCPDCLSPFDAAGRATCKHRVAACQQPTILRLFESSALEDEDVANELRRALAADSRHRGILPRGWSPLRRFGADEPDAWPRPTRFLFATMRKILLILLVWIAAGWAVIAWIPSVYLLAALGRFTRRSNHAVRGRVFCTNCRFIIHDLVHTPVCTECASDLTKTGSVRTALERDRTSPLVSIVLAITTFAVALTWGVYLAPLALRLVPTSVLIAAIDVSIGSAREYIDVLGRRVMTQEENAAATAAILAWSNRNPFGNGSRQASVIPTPETLATLDEESLATVLSGVPSPAWIATTSRGWPELALRPDAVVPRGADVVANITDGLPTKATAVPLLLMIEVGDIVATRLTDGRSVTIPSTAESRQYELYGFQVCTLSSSAPIGQLDPGSYELSATYTVRILPPVASGTISSPRTIEQARKTPPSLTRPVSIRVKIE